MSLFNFDELELMTFFAVLVRFSVTFAVLPLIGDRFVPAPVKVLLALVVSVALFPSLVLSKQVHPHDALKWGASAGGIASTIGAEVLYGLVLGFTAKMCFEAITFGGNLVGNFMGFGAASTYDPHQESQTQIVAEIQMAIAMLIFLAIDGHHLMLRAALDSFKILGVGGAVIGHQAVLGANLSAKILEISGDVIKFGIILASPIAISLFAVNVAFGVMAKALPNLNILVLSFAVSALVGLLVMLMSVPEFSTVTENILSRVGDWMDQVLLAIASGR